MLSKNRQESMSAAIKTWHSQVSAPLQVKSLPPITIKTVFHDAMELFGTNFNQKVTLREDGHLEACKDIILHHFDPNFQSTDVYCRQPSCWNINREAAKKGKRDLYLCPLHRKNLRTSIEISLARRKIHIPRSTELLKEEHFTGYTSLIGLLEEAYHNSKKWESFQKGKLTPMIKEAILNVRNVLIITSTVLNPDGNNLALILPYVFTILDNIVNNPVKSIRIVADLVSALKEVIDMILSAFGVMYRWVSVALPRPDKSKPGWQIGGGLGGAIGLAAGFFFGPVGAGVAGMAAGLFLGGLAGNGIEQVVKYPRQQAIDIFAAGWHGDCRVQPYRVYNFEGNASGGLYLCSFPAN